MDCCQHCLSAARREWYEPIQTWCLKKKPEGGRCLNVAQKQAILLTICDKRPNPLSMDFASWSRATARQHIKLSLGIKLSMRAVVTWLARWGFTPQKPIKKADAQRHETVQAWLDDHCAAIESQARAQGGELHWGDETALVNTDIRGRSYAPMGKIPVTFAVGGTRHKLSMIVTVINRGMTRWTIIDESSNSNKLIEFLESLIKETQRNVFLVLHELRVHHSKPVKAWAALNAEKMALFCLSSCSPELNPEERLNAELKHAITSKGAVHTEAKLRGATEHMAMLEQNPEPGKKCFGVTNIAYAGT